MPYAFSNVWSVLAYCCQTGLASCQVLEATNLVLAACQMTTVLGVATDMLYRAIQSHYSSKADKNSTTAVASVDGDALQLQYLQPLDKQRAREYLQKIVQASCQPSGTCSSTGVQCFLDIHHAHQISNMHGSLHV